MFLEAPDHRDGAVAEVGHDLGDDHAAGGFFAGHLAQGLGVAV
jgi:hypothetical protein